MSCPAERKNDAPLESWPALEGFVTEWPVKKSVVLRGVEVLSRRGL